MGSVYFARWVLLADGTILNNGAVAVEGSVISSIGQRGSVRRGSADRLVNLGNMLLMPGLINLHTHLEESFMRGWPPGPDEAHSSRLAKKTTRLRQAPFQQVASAVRLCARELLANGITTIMDSSRRGISPAILGDEPLRAWVLHELHAEDGEQEARALLAMRERRAALPAALHSAVGPFALFSLSPDGHRTAAAFAREHGSVWMTHIAESAEELQAFSELAGDLYFHITRRRPWTFGPKSPGPLHYALANQLIPRGGICCRCNYSTGHELALLAAMRVSVVISPVCSDAQGHNRFPLDVAIDRKVNICVATESIADSGSADLFDQLHFLKRAYPHVPTATMLRWVTRNPAEALGMGRQLGSLEEGKLADLVGIKFGYDPKGELLDDLVMEDHGVGLVVVNGEEVIADY